MSINKRLPLLCVFFITAVGFLVRIYHIDSNPAGFFCDEAATGYNAYTILTTGKDEYGKSFPVFFQSFNNYRPGLAFYLTLPFVLMFGLNEFATRVPTAIIGACTIPLVYLLTFLLTKRRSVGVVASLFLAISPWHIHFSRVDSLIHYPFFVCLGLTLFLLSVQSNKFFLWVMSALTFGLSLYTYYQAYLFVPLILLTLLVLYRHEIFTYRRQAVAACLTFVICILPFIYAVKTEPVLSRFNAVSTSFAGKSTKEILLGIGATYIGHFSRSFLFADGDIGYKGHFIQRYSVRGLGELYWLQLPLILVGLVTVFKRKKMFILLLVWLLLYPLGSSLAPFADGGGPFATRSFIGVIPFQILTGAGFIAVVTFFRRAFLRYIIAGILLILTILSFGQYTYKYFVEYPLYSQDFWGWQFGARDIMQTFLTTDTLYDDYVMIGEFNAPDIFIRFYDPANRCSSRCRVGGISDINPQKRQLIALSPSALLQASHYTLITKKIILYPNGKPAYYIQATR